MSSSGTYDYSAYVTQEESNKRLFHAVLTGKVDAVREVLAYGFSNINATVRTSPPPLISLSTNALALHLGLARTHPLLFSRAWVGEPKANQLARRCLRSFLTLTNLFIFIFFALYDLCAVAVLPHPYLCVHTSWYVPFSPPSSHQHVSPAQANTTTTTTALARSGRCHTNSLTLMIYE
jgi:hypothetical protein